MSRGATRKVHPLPKQIYVAQDDEDGEVRYAATLNDAVNVFTEAWNKKPPHAVAVYVLKEVVTVRRVLKVMGRRGRTATRLEELVLGEGVESA